MNKKIAFLLIAVLLFNIVLVSEVDAAKMHLSVSTFEKAASKTGDFLKRTLFLWYTTDSAKRLKPEYENQRRVVDFTLYFILFFSLSLLGLRKVFEKGGNAVIGLAFAIGALLSLALVAFVRPSPIALMFPYAKNLLYLIVVLVTYTLLSKIFKPEKTFSKLVLLLLAAIITYLAFGLFGMPVGTSDMSLARTDQTAAITDLKAKLEADPYDRTARDALVKSLFIQGEKLVNEGKYDEARKHFLEAIYTTNNVPEGEVPKPTRYYDKSKEWLDEKLFTQMAKRNLRLMDATIVALNELKEMHKAEKDPVKKIELCEQIAQLYEATKKFHDELDEELKKQEAKIKE